MSTVESVPTAALSARTGHARVLAAEVDPGETQPALMVRDGPAWAVAFIRSTYTHATSMVFHGDDGSGALVGPRVVAALEHLVASAPFAPWLSGARAKGVRAISLPRAAEPLGGLLPRARERWEWMSTTRVPAVATGPAPVELGANDRAQVQAILDTHNPGTDGQPYARPGQRWLGIRGEDGRLLAVGCCEREVSGAPVLSGITVDPAARGRGAGRAITAELTRGAIEEHGWCTLGMYSINDTARRMYLALGYEIGALWSSGELV